MPAERMPMRRVRDVLRLRSAGVGLNEIARRVGVAPSTVRLTLKRLAGAGLSWPLPAEITDEALEAALPQALIDPADRAALEEHSMGRDRLSRTRAASNWGNPSNPKTQR